MGALDGLTTASQPIWQKGFVPTGIPSLDWALGGGWRYGGLAEIYGNWGSGKTIMLYLTLISCQQNGGVAVLLETEGAFNPFLFELLGGDLDNLLVREVETTEDFFTAVQKLLKKIIEAPGEPEVVIALDSIAALSTDHLQAKGMAKRDLSKALTMSQGCQLIISLVSKAKALVIASNQIRVASFDARGQAREESTGGKSWPFYSSQRVQLAFANPKGQTTTYRTSDIVDDETGVEIGKRLVGEVTKNRAAPAFRRVVLPFYTEPQYPHPTFTGQITKLGVDVDEALLEWYLSNERTFFHDGKRHPYVLKAGKGGGYYDLHPLITKNIEGWKKFRKKDWPKVLEVVPQLSDPDYTPAEEKE